MNWTIWSRTTSNAFLGVTVGCARCHNHKFDPIPQKDYYRMQAVFFPAKPLEYPLVVGGRDRAFKAEQKRIDDLQAPWKEQSKQLEQPYRDRMIAEKKAKLPDYIQLALRTPPEKRTEGQKLNATQVEKTLSIEHERADCRALARGQRRATTQLTARDQGTGRPAAGAIRRRQCRSPKPDAKPTPSYFLHRGSPGAKGQRDEARRPYGREPLRVVFPGAAVRRARLAGAGEGSPSGLPRRDNPLTARVMVNRIWQHHFGEGIVRTPNNFGKMGERPTHPELLDWLATEFVQKGWSVKAMHRLIMNSETYQMASADIAANVAIDRENRYLWRMPRRRLEGEAIRDSIMAVAGNLDRTVGGPAFIPYIDPALFQSSSKRTWKGKPDSDPSTWRRSVYVFSKRSIPLPMLEVFDKPDSVGSCARRNRSTIAPQA